RPGIGSPWFWSTVVSLRFVTIDRIGSSDRTSSRIAGGTGAGVGVLGESRPVDVAGVAWTRLAPWRVERSVAVVRLCSYAHSLLLVETLIRGLRREFQCWMRHGLTSRTDYRAVDTALPSTVETHSSRTCFHRSQHTSLD